MSRINYLLTLKPDRAPRSSGQRLWRYFIIWGNAVKWGKGNLSFLHPSLRRWAALRSSPASRSRTPSPHSPRGWKWGCCWRASAEVCGGTRGGRRPRLCCDGTTMCKCTRRPCSVCPRPRENVPMCHLQLRILETEKFLVLGLIPPHPPP